MAGDSPRKAVEAFVERLQRTIQCVGNAHIVASGAEPDKTHAVAMWPHQPGFKDRLPLRARDSGRPDLLLDVALDYAVVRTSDEAHEGAWIVRSRRYSFHILDVSGRELVLYHWHPAGVSSVAFPHVHVPCMPVTALPRMHGNDSRSIDLAKFHLPTNHVLLEDVIELLIRDFAVEPRHHFRERWRDVLRRNRIAAQREFELRQAGDVS